MKSFSEYINEDEVDTANKNLDRERKKVSDTNKKIIQLKDRKKKAVKRQREQKKREQQNA